MIAAFVVPKTPDDEYISRKEALKAIDDYSDFNTDKFHREETINKRLGLARAREAVEELPAADVRPVVRGEWIDEHPDKPNDPRMRCSVCTCVEAPLVKWRFCPNCGALLREES